MTIDPRVEPVKKEIASLELSPLKGLALTVFAKAVVAERDDDHTAANKWLGHAVKQEAKQASA